MTSDRESLYDRVGLRKPVPYDGTWGDLEVPPIEHPVTMSLTELYTSLWRIWSPR